nr:MULTISPECIES: peptidylprolyl isomerase [Chroococcidiopsis]
MSFIMLEAIAVSRDDIIEQIKLLCQIPSIIEAIVSRQIIANAAKEAGITVELAELQQGADNFRLSNNLIRADDTWSWLHKQSLSLNEFEQLIYTTIISEKLARHLFADKVESVFFEQQLNYGGVVMYEVVLDDRDLALELFYALQEGEIGFCEVARQYIQDKELRRAGGYRGMLRRSELKPEISAAVFAATPPQMLKPIVTSKGTHLILVEEIVHPQLDDTLRLKILADLFTTWLKQQIEQVEIVKYLDPENLAANFESQVSNGLISDRL